MNALDSAHPDDLSDEDLIALFRTGTPQQREDAASELYPRIRRIARRVVQHRPVGKQCKCDFEEEMPAEILAKLGLGAFDPAKGCFDGWCFVVLCNRYKDWIDQWVRQHGPERPLSPGDLPEITSVSPDGTSGEDVLAPATQCDDGPRGTCSDEQFSGRELALLQKMPRLQRVICVSAAGWSPRVPAEVWQQWLATARIQPPFPPAEIFDEDKPTKRLPLMAEALGKKPEGFRQHWYRGRESDPFREVSGGQDFDDK